MTSIEFDHYGDGFNTDPFGMLADLREKCPVAHSESHGGFWVLSRYEDIRKAAYDTATFSSRIASVPAPKGEGNVLFPPLNLDPPVHRAYKHVLSSALVPRRIVELEEITRRSAVDCVESFLDKGRCDVSWDFARIVPISVLNRLLGMPDGMEDVVSGWVRQLLDENAEAEHVEAFLAIRGIIAPVIAARRTEPGDDLFSFLIDAGVDGRPLTEDELILIGIEMLAAGLDTTWSLLGATLHHLAQHPEQQRLLRERPELMTSAREEFLRAFAPVMIGREIAVDTEVGGCPMKAGDLALLALNSACRDESVFPGAADLVLDREPNPHLAFGVGPHRCVGSNLARMEIMVAMTEFITRMPEFRLDESRPVEWSRGQIRGPRSVPILF